MINTFLSIGSFGLSTFSAISGFTTGRKAEKFYTELRKLNLNVERISDAILYTPDVLNVRDLAAKSGSQNIVTDIEKIKDVLEPVQHSFGSNLFSSGIIPTPTKMLNALQKDPWEVLIDVRPKNRSKRPNDPDLVPILFEDRGTAYIGWQKQGTLPFLFNCKYDPQGFRNIVAEQKPKRSLILPVPNRLNLRFKNLNQTNKGTEGLPEIRPPVLEIRLIKKENK